MRAVARGLTIWQISMLPTRESRVMHSQGSRLAASPRKAYIFSQAARTAWSRVLPGATVMYSSAVFRNGVGRLVPLMTLTRTVISPLTSRPQVEASPSPITACRSPMASSAPGTFTGRYRVVPS